MGGEVRRADPVKCSDAGILGREKMFGHGQTYFESLRFCSDRGKIRKFRPVLYIFDLYIHPLVLYKNDTRPAKETAADWTGDLTYTSHPLTPPCSTVQLLYRLPQRLRALGEFLECGPILVAHQGCLRVNEFYLLLKPAEKM